MADIKISEFGTVSFLDTNAYIPIIQGSPLDDKIISKTDFGNQLPAIIALNSTKSNTGHTHYQLYQPNGTNPFVYTDNGGTLHIDGNITQSGASYTTHANNIYTTGDTITLRDGAVVGLTNGQYTGFVAKLYDGLNDGHLVFDKDGWARVGDIGQEQKIAAIEETPTDNYIFKWNNSTLRLESMNPTALPISTSTQTALNQKVNTGTTINGYTLNNNITLTSTDLGVYTSGQTDNLLSLYSKILDFGKIISGSTTKSTPIGADQFGYRNSVDNTFVNISVTDLITYLKVNIQYPEVNITATGGTVTLQPNVMSVFTTILTSGNTINLVLDSPISGIVNEYPFKIKIGSSLPNFTHPSGIYWFGNNPVTLEVNSQYIGNAIRGSISDSVFGISYKIDKN